MDLGGGRGDAAVFGSGHKVLHLTQRNAIKHDGNGMEASAVDGGGTCAVAEMSSALTPGAGGCDTAVYPLCLVRGDGAFHGCPCPAGSPQSKVAGNAKAWCCAWVPCSRDVVLYLRLIDLPGRIKRLDGICIEPVQAQVDHGPIQFAID